MVELYHWHTEPLLVASLVITVWLFALLTGPWRQRILSSEEPYPLKEALWFYSGVIAFYITVGSPIDALGEGFLLSVHMLQHLLLMYVCPPLIILGLPANLIDHFFLKHCAPRSLLIFFLKPWIGGLLLTITFTLWHVPTLYEAALRNKLIHVIEHLSIFFPALMVWWLILSRSKTIPQIGFGAQIILMIALAVAQTPVFAYMVFAGEILYPTYEYAPRIIDLSPGGDQMLAGVIMKIGNMLVVLGILGRSMYYWVKADSNRTFE